MLINSRVNGMIIYHCLILPTIIDITQVLPWIYLRHFIREDIGLNSVF